MLSARPSPPPSSSHTHSRQGEDAEPRPRCVSDFFASPTVRGSPRTLLQISARSTFLTRSKSYLPGCSRGPAQKPFLICMPRPLPPSPPLLSPAPRSHDLRGGLHPPPSDSALGGPKPRGGNRSARVRLLAVGVLGGSEGEHFPSQIWALEAAGKSVGQRRRCK